MSEVVEMAEAGIRGAAIGGAIRDEILSPRFQIGDVIVSKKPYRGETAYLVRKKSSISTSIYPFREGKWSDTDETKVSSYDLNKYRKVGHIHPTYVQMELLENVIMPGFPILPKDWFKKLDAKKYITGGFAKKKKRKIDHILEGVEKFKGHDHLLGASARGVVTQVLVSALNRRILETQHDWLT